MGSVGLGSVLSSLGSQYDFTKMTNKQFLTAVENLGGEGKISQTDATQLSAVAQGVDYSPVNRQDVFSVQQILSDPTQHNWIAHLQEDDDGAHMAGAVGGALYDSMLKDLDCRIQQDALSTGVTGETRWAGGSNSRTLGQHKSRVPGWSDPGLDFETWDRKNYQTSSLKLRYSRINPH